MGEGWPPLTEPSRYSLWPLLLGHDYRDGLRLAHLFDCAPVSERWVIDEGLAQLGERAIASAKQQGASNLAASYQISGALIEAMYGNLPEARKAVAKAGDFSQDWALEADAAMVFALAGDMARAQKLADDVEKRLPEATYIRFGALPAIRSLLALH